MKCLRCGQRSSLLFAMFIDLKDEHGTDGAMQPAAVCICCVAELIGEHLEPPPSNSTVGFVQ